MQSFAAGEWIRIVQPQSAFFFSSISREGHWRFVTRSIERKRPSALTRERSLSRMKPGTAAYVHAADTHVHTHTHTHTTARKKHLHTGSAGTETEKFAPKRCSRPRDGSVKRTVRTQWSPRPTNMAHLTGSIVLDVCFPRRISRRACRCWCCSGTTR